MLVSADYLADDALVADELLPAMKRHLEGEAHVLPIILRPVDWSDASFAALEVLPRDGLPLTAWPDRQMILRDVAQRINALRSALPSRVPNRV